MLLDNFYLNWWCKCRYSCMNYNYPIKKRLRGGAVKSASIRGSLTADFPIHFLDFDLVRLFCCMCFRTDIDNTRRIPCTVSEFRISSNFMTVWNWLKVYLEKLSSLLLLPSYLCTNFSPPTFLHRFISPIPRCMLRIYLKFQIFF